MMDYWRELGLTTQQIGYMVAAPYEDGMTITIPVARALGFQWQTVPSLFAVRQCQAHYCLAVP